MIRGWLIVALASLTWWSTPAPANAHTDLISSSPTTDEVLTGFPETVQLVFSEPVAPEFVTVTLTQDAGPSLELAPRAEGATVTAPVPALKAAGDTPADGWTLSYRVVSTDGHPITGHIAFRVTGSGSTSDKPTQAVATPATEGSRGQGRSVIIIGVFSAVTTIAAMYLLARGRARDRHE
ncbi:copper resistance CopC family protein [Nocardioides sp.]|uniref:Putative Copper resistance protein CopC n=1 Tax=metagenome TaxID=256318 RepID=A0A2P2C0T7_9ZZZZ